MNPIGNSIRRMARSLRRDAQTPLDARPRTDLVADARQTFARQLWRHRPVERMGVMDAEFLDTDLRFEGVKTLLDMSLPKQRHNRHERSQLLDHNGFGGPCLKEAIESRISALRSDAAEFPVPAKGAATADDVRTARRFLNAVQEQLTGLEALMSLPDKGLSARRKAHIRESIVRMKDALAQGKVAFPNPKAG